MDISNQSQYRKVEEVDDI